MKMILCNRDKIKLTGYHSQIIIPLFSDSKDRQYEMRRFVRIMNLYNTLR